MSRSDVPRDEATVLDVVHAARLAIEFVASETPSTLVADRKSQSAVLYQLLVLGEAVKRLSTEYRSRHGQIPWKDIAGFRDRLIHGYDKVDWERVWEVLTTELPTVLPRL